jgi:hypothetical protein
VVLIAGQIDTLCASGNTGSLTNLQIQHEQGGAIVLQTVLQTDLSGRLKIAALSEAALGGAGGHLAELRQWYQGVRYSGASTVLDLGGTAYRQPDGNPTPLEVAEVYPQEAGVETWGCRQSERWEKVMHEAGNLAWRDVPPVLPVIHPRHNRTVAHVVCHYDLSAAPVNYRAHLRMYSQSLPQSHVEAIPEPFRQQVLSLRELPRVILIGGRHEIGSVYDRGGSLAVSVGSFSPITPRCGGAVLSLLFTNPGIDRQATKITFSDYQL